MLDGLFVHEERTGRLLLSAHLQCCTADAGRVTLTRGANVTSQRVRRSPGEDGGEEDQGAYLPLNTAVSNNDSNERSPTKTRSDAR